MDQPKTPQLETLMATVAEIRQLQQRLKELKERTSTEAHALYDIADRNLRLQSAAYAYWYAPEVNAKDLAFGAIRQAHPSKLVKLIGSQPSNIPCVRPVRNQHEDHVADGDGRTSSGWRSYVRRRIPRNLP
jgi:hypothetical protein